ncbi:MAG: hypothetical protein GF417_12855 [Candidatus Latescibacteria bacterium]|nr:hypothetical protein [bacterium]MBD3425318.1 hypothetical protein [Candidatus Latescibacterota bacterium]
MRNKAFIHVAIIFLVSVVLFVSGDGNAGQTARSASELIAGMEPVPGWSPQGEMAVYHADNLWEYINGSAEKFMSYDFVETAAQDFASEDGMELKVEVYQHGSSRMAFGIYSQFSMGKKDNGEIGTLSFAGGYSLHFWKGDYYVKVSLFEKSEYLSERMKEFAHAIASGIPEKGSLPEGVGYLPEQGLDKTRIGYVAEGVMGSGKLPPAVTAEYGLDDKDGKLYLFCFDTARESGALFKELSQKIEGEPVEVAGDGPGHNRVSGSMKYRGQVLLFQYDRIAAVITGFHGAAETAVGLEGAVIKEFREAEKPLLK